MNPLIFTQKLLHSPEGDLHISTFGGKNLCIANASILLQIQYFWEELLSLGQRKAYTG